MSPFPPCCNVLGLLNFPAQYHKSQIQVTLILQSTYLTCIPIAAPQSPPTSLLPSHYNLFSSSPHPLPPAATVSAISLCLLCSLQHLPDPTILLQPQPQFHDDICQFAVCVHHSWCGATRALAGAHVAIGPATQECMNENKVCTNKLASCCLSGNQCDMLPTRCLVGPPNGFKDGIWSQGLCCSRHVLFSSLGGLPAVCLKVGSDPKEQNRCQPPSAMMLRPHSIFITQLQPYSRHVPALLWCPCSWKTVYVQSKGSFFILFGKVFLVKMQTKILAWRLGRGGAESLVSHSECVSTTSLLCSIVHLYTIQSAYPFRGQGLPFHSVLV